MTMIDYNLDYENQQLSAEITVDEIKKKPNCIRNLKTDKAAGDDQFINEYLKSAANTLMPLYLNPFNLNLKIGKFPATWTLMI